jgi:23S rRNA pseudouridine1911/1915/1917 synthase
VLSIQDDFTHAKIAEQFTNRTVEKEYQAICWGKFKNSQGEISTIIARSKKDRKVFTSSETEGKPALTFYEVLEEFEFTSLVKLNLKTGRTHQIRVHLSGLGKPIFGDSAYGGRQIRYGSEQNKIKSLVKYLLKLMSRQALHAKSLGFVHPQTKKLISFDSDLPDDMKLLISKLREISF